MKRVLTAVVLIPLVLLVLFKAPLWLFTLVVGAVAMGAAWEYLKLVDAYNLASMKIPTLSFILICFLTLIFAHWDIFNIALALVAFFVFPLILLSLAMRTDELSNALPRSTASAFAVPYVLIPMMCLIWIRSRINATFFILCLLILVWTGDICAYYVGRAFGKHKLAPRISPGKSWEGTIASFAGAIVMGALLLVARFQIMNTLYQWHICSEPTPPSPRSNIERLLIGVMVAIFINVAAQIGDLAESLIKRGAGVKDSGNLLPGHGGILDRIDALLFAAPVAWLFAIFFQFT
jgi:phosphatidate cytidylyltransferase